MQDELFEGRTIKPFAEYVLWPDLAVGQTYFAVDFVDDDLHVPEVRPLVFVGRNLNEGDSNLLYFQDAYSYRDGLRFETLAEGDDALFHTIADTSPFVQTFERALDVLLRCSLERRRSKRA